MSRMKVDAMLVALRRITFRQSFVASGDPARQMSGILPGGAPDIIDRDLFRFRMEGKTRFSTYKREIGLRDGSDPTLPCRLVIGVTHIAVLAQDIQNRRKLAFKFR